MKLSRDAEQGVTASLTEKEKENSKPAQTERKGKKDSPKGHEKAGKGRGLAAKQSVDVTAAGATAEEAAAAQKDAKSLRVPAAAPHAEETGQQENQQHVNKGTGKGRQQQAKKEEQPVQARVRKSEPAQIAAKPVPVKRKSVPEVPSAKRSQPEEAGPSHRDRKRAKASAQPADSNETWSTITVQESGSQAGQAAAKAGTGKGEGAAGKKADALKGKQAAAPTAAKAPEAAAAAQRATTTAAAATVVLDQAEAATAKRPARPSVPAAAASPSEAVLAEAGPAAPASASAAADFKKLQVCLAGTLTPMHHSMLLPTLSASCMFVHLRREIS